jgi:hypothetical protein
MDAAGLLDEVEIVGDGESVTDGDDD